MKIPRKPFDLPAMKATLLRRSRLNKAALAFLVAASALIAGCAAPGRQGPFMELSAGIDAAAADEKWTVSKHGFDDGTDGDVQRHDAVAMRALPAGSLKIGYGLTEQFLYSMSVQTGKLTRFAGGIMFFTKKTAPSLILDVNYGVSWYNLISLPNRFPDNVAVDKRAGADGWNVGVGYEFKRNWIIKGDFSYGTYSFYDSSSSANLGDALLILITLGSYDIDPYYKIEGEATAYSFGFRIGYILY